VLDGVVAVDVQVTLGIDLEVDRAVAGDLVEHVVEEADPGRDLRCADAVEVDAHADLRLLGVAADGRAPRRHGVRDGRGGGHRRLARKASIIRVFSSAVPTVRRRQSARSGWSPSTFLTRTPRDFIPSNTAAARGTRTRIMFASLAKAVTPGVAASSLCSRARSPRSSAAWRANSPAFS